MKILFFINALQHGGAARVISIISNELASRGHEIFVMADILYQEVNFEFNSNTNLISIFTEGSSKYPGIVKKFHSCYNVRKNIKRLKPDIIVGVLPGNFLKVMICSLGLSIPIVASDHTSFDRKIDWYNNFIRFHLYNFANAVTILTEADDTSLGKRLPKRVIMPNPLTYNILPEQNIKANIILAVGRLDAWHVKGFDILIEVWARIAKKYPDWILEFAGNGSSESLSTLKGLISKLGITNHVNFLGFSTDMEKIYRKSAIFALSSRYEGFGMAIIEAMSQGCACVCFDHGGRQSEIITSSKSGIIIKNQNKDEMEKAFIGLIEDDSLRKSIGEYAKQEVIRYSKEAVVERWEMLFTNLASQN